jgi:hypothetical protein
MSLKNPVTPPGTDLGTVRLVEQRVNHYATAGPMPSGYYREKLCFTSNAMKKLFFVYKHDSTSSSSSSSSNTIFVTRVFYSPDSGRANQNVNCHNLRASTPFFLLHFRLQPSLETHQRSEQKLVLPCRAIQNLDPVTLPAVSTPISLQSTAPRKLYARRVIKTHSVSSLGDIG